MFPENFGPRMAIDETSLSDGELYTIITNRDRHGRERCLAAIIVGTCADDVTEALDNVPEEYLDRVEKLTLDLSDSMRSIAK